MTLFRYRFNLLAQRATRVHRSRRRDVASFQAGAATVVPAFADFPVPHWKKIWSTNPLEWLDKEIKRRTDVVGVFTSTTDIGPKGLRIPFKSGPTDLTGAKVHSLLARVLTATLTPGTRWPANPPSATTALVSARAPLPRGPHERIL
jgi:Transposase, Mutator family